MEDDTHVQLENGDGDIVLATIPLQQMIQQTEVRAPADDWTGVTNAAERRKLQNRLHQRLWRKRQSVNKSRNPTRVKHSRLNTEGKDHESVPAVNLLAPTTPVSVKTADSSISPPTSAVAAKPPTTICNWDPIDTKKIVEQFHTWYLVQMKGSPSADQLLSLVQFNVFRALMSNTFCLGFGTEWLSEDAISPFNNISVGCGGLAASYPASLRPTTLQHSVVHHPWIDLFPMPAFRDNLLAADGFYDEDQLCADLVEFCNVPGEMGGLLVWGDPSNQFCWEVSEQFAKKWGWVLKGCHELLTSTNYWRKKRGEKRLIFEV